MKRRIAFLIAIGLLTIGLFAPPSRAQENRPNSDTAVARKVAESAEPAHGAENGESVPPLLPANMQEAKEWALPPAIWTIVIFLIMLAILYPTAWKNVLAGLKAREARIRGDIANAEAQRRQAEATLKQYNDQLAGAEARIRDMLAKAQADGEKLATSIRMQAQQEAEEAKEKAQRDIDASKDAAIREVYEQTANLATSVAEKILRRNLNADDQRELVRQSLDQLKSVKV